MTAIKMCGFTREDDARVAAALGVHALGFILWPGSPRHAPVDVAARIITSLPPFVMPVGVFVSPSAGEVAAAVTGAGIGLAQIHGDEPEWPSGKPPVPVLRVVHLAEGDRCEPDVPVPAAVLLDSLDPVRHGGTGRTVEWTRAAAVARTRPVVLAGGLSPANVAEAIAVVRPYGVDVASGIESRPGIKDHELMRRFVAAVKENE